MAHSTGVTDQQAVGDSSVDESPMDAFADAAAYAQQIKVYASYYLSTRLDAVKAATRRAIVYAIAGVVAALIAATALVMAVVLLMLGLSNLINWALHFAYAGLSPWIGPVIVGAGLLGLVMLAAMVIIPRRFRAWHYKTLQKYARKRQQQREKVEQDVRQRANAKGV